jgi:formamidopyrimidine-DNA glycosylase
VPELPEVEVLRRSLEPHLIGERIVSVLVRNPALRVRVRPAQLSERTTRRRVLGLRRRSKYLLIDLERDSTLVVHLGMSGRLCVADRRKPAEAHEHVVFRLSSGRDLRFRDPRRFGIVQALTTSTLERSALLRDLGVEPLSAEFDGARLRALASGRRGPVKSFLMDGRLVVGVGNIYASESLHQAGIHPRRSVARIGAVRWDALAAAVRSVLERAIDDGGTTLNDFANGLGEQGYFQTRLAVYDRAGEACARCGTAIRRIVQSGRASYFCPGCQR